MPEPSLPPTTSLPPRGHQTLAGGQSAPHPSRRRGARHRALTDDARRGGNAFATPAGRRVSRGADGPGGAGRLPARRPRAAKPTLLIAIALGLLSLPTLIGVPLAPLSGCARWIAFAAALELMSLFGFAVVFKLVFCPQLSWRGGLSAALRGLGASTVLPAGGLIGPAVGAYSPRPSGASLARIARSAVAFVVLTNAPSVAMLAAVGLAIGAGLLAGPHDAALTLLPGGLALAVLAAGFLTRARPGVGTASRSRSPRPLVRTFVATLSSLRDGVSEARTLVLGGDWKLLGALAYYAFDNAVLWAAFHAYGRTPSPGVLAMGYLVGSLGAALPTPAGIGAVEGGLIGALVLYGAPAAPAAAAVLLYRGVSLLIAVPLGALAWAPQPLAKLRHLPAGIGRLTPPCARRGAVDLPTRRRWTALWSRQPRRHHSEAERV